MLDPAVAADMVVGETALVDLLAVRLPFPEEGIRFIVREELSLMLLQMIEEIGGSFAVLEKETECCEPLPGIFAAADIFLSSSPLTIVLVESPPKDLPSSVIWW